MDFLLPIGESFIFFALFFWILVVQKTADLSQGNRWHRFERGLLAEFAADGGCVPPDLQPTLPAQSKKSPWRIDGFKFLV